MKYNTESGNVMNILYSHFRADRLELDFLNKDALNLLIFAD